MNAVQTAPVVTCTLIIHQLQRRFCASVHRAGCAAIKKDRQNHAGILVDVPGTAADAVAYWLGSPAVEGDPANLGYTADDVNVCNCARKGRKEG